MTSISNSEKLNHYIIRVSKEDSAFVYFQLESNEGLAFYSTLKSSLKEPFRDIEIFSPLSLNQEITHFIDYIGQALRLEIRSHHIIEDAENASSFIS